MRFRANSFVAKLSLLDFDLSRNMSLISLEIPVTSVDYALRYDSLDTAAGLFKYVLPTIRSPSFSRVHLIYVVGDFRAIRTTPRSAWPFLRELSQDEKADEASLHHMRFKLLGEVRKVRDFQLVLHADVWEPVREYAVRMLKEAVVAEGDRGGFDDFLSEPSVTFFPRSHLRL